MKFRMLVSVCAAFVLVFSMTLGYYSGAVAGGTPWDCLGDNICDCCQVGNLAGTYWSESKLPPFTCRCNGCGDGPVILNPCDCLLFCPPHQ